MRALVCAMGVFVSAAHADAGAEPPVFDGYEAFYAMLPGPLFSAQDARKRGRSGLGDPAGDFWKWTALGKAHVLELRGADLLIDGKRLKADGAKRFDGEGVAPSLGRGATIYANDDTVCVEGIPSSASGTAVRHVRVSVITRPYDAKARRFEFPSLFASCLGLTRTSSGGIGFLRAAYRWPVGTPAPQGVTFEGFTLKDGVFSPTGQTTQATFVEPDNVYRFTMP